MVKIIPAPISNGWNGFTGFLARQQERPTVQRIERGALYLVSAGAGAVSLAAGAVASRSQPFVEQAIQTLSSNPHFNATAIARGAAFIAEKGGLPSVNPTTKYLIFMAGAAISAICIFKQANSIGAKKEAISPSSPRGDRLKTL